MCERGEGGLLAFTNHSDRVNMCNTACVHLTHTHTHRYTHTLLRHANMHLLLHVYLRFWVKDLGAERDALAAELGAVGEDLEALVKENQVCLRVRLFVLI